MNPPSTIVSPASKMDAALVRPYFSVSADEGRSRTLEEIFAKEVNWETRTVTIKDDETGKVSYHGENLRFPKSWSAEAGKIVASKYFYKRGGQPVEVGVDQFIDRVVSAIADEGHRKGYLKSESERELFRAELGYAMIKQMVAFNSPVNFNVGTERSYGNRHNERQWYTNVDVKPPRVEQDASGEHPQASACFINSISDHMDSITDLAKTEVSIFKYGSGTGTNLSPLRSSKEYLSTGGMASGPVSFMRGYDAFAGVIKSGGRTRRAAKMNILNVDHPDIVDFIRCKEKAEVMAGTLTLAGFGGRGPDDEAHGNIPFQNGNNSVRVTDEFMRAVEEDKEWHLKAVTTGEIIQVLRARDLWKMIGRAAWVCGDPGLQFDTTINKWHTSITDDRIYASNPCSEYMFLNDSACNLASINLLKCSDGSGNFDIETFHHLVDITILAQEILVGMSGYPTKSIAENSHRHRPLGIGYANLGALLMMNGLPYDSDEGRALAAAITANLTGRGYAQSARIAQVVGPCEGDARNRGNMIRVIDMHTAAVDSITAPLEERLAAPVPDSGNGRAHGRLRAVYDAVTSLQIQAKRVWNSARNKIEQTGYRNAQISVLAPTGTIAFMMDCDTTGVEPDISLVKKKKLVGGGELKYANETITPALRNLGYSEDQVKEIVAYVKANNTVEGAPGMREEHLAIFDCAFRPAKGTRSISVNGHVDMMIAIQPFLSGAISKTVNLPGDATEEDILGAYERAWKGGLKAIAVYRDRCKMNQPMEQVGDKQEPIAHPETLEDALQNVIRHTPFDMAVKGLLKRKDVDIAKIVNGALTDPVKRELRQNHGQYFWGDKRPVPDDGDDGLWTKPRINGKKYHANVTTYPEGTPAEIFLAAFRKGSHESTLLSVIGVVISEALKHGLPVQRLIEVIKGTRDDTGGWVQSDRWRIKKATSILDYIGKWMQIQFQADPSVVPEKLRAGLDLSKTYINKYRARIGLPPILPPKVAETPPPPTDTGAESGAKSDLVQPPSSLQTTPNHKQPSPGFPNLSSRDLERGCSCGGTMYPTGTCWTCDECGTSDGGC